MAAGYPRRDPVVVLVADDESFVRNFVGDALEKKGCISLMASDGTEALQISREYPSAIDLLLSDVDMPNLSGLELAKQILVERPDIRILLISGRAHSTNTSLPLLSKPFTVQQLLAKVQDVLAAAPDNGISEL
jgi:CheY-like chemotaxis protein